MNRRGQPLLAFAAAVASAVCAVACTSVESSASPDAPERVLVVVSSHDTKGAGQVAGFWFPELTHPVEVYDKAGFEVDIASPQGGLAPFDGFDLQDPVNQWFWTNPEYRNKLGNTLKLSEVDPSRYDAVQLTGGHGPMWDFTQNTDLNDIVRGIYEDGGVVSAVCHGPAGLLDISLSNGESLIAGRHLTGFTNEEEVSRGYDQLVPFELETALKDRGAVFESAPAFQNRVVTDGRLVTGQNPASAHDFGQAVVAAVDAGSSS
ncbi:type 1 glutamine amidotransferase domain-containing protein [Mycolicibacterium diernhoferi]|uniref:Type 1 glutamine amidotransferase domain-containing protein n=1 Tax=Mycolicibacterium diernhoferi TaxID=1801 RepID=A0A1Q4HAA8_9MYCO|nr:type 1 glutamine amidotransferase domain-containing protein [Mycolicibacterium diernhoferi]OPE47609.1 type 1 glutamine amidotransferase domain-containing protein [Mycolicibacterium diernhoferi]PEG52301.1 type 1 glutamine amidotransferase domain-containing protein [Mycolicibacterium diernhoferi]QYL24301.1 type 1 glutamine amidotransferase domain-containing protein [Mycolicibacterium diernhoferi]